MSSHIQSLQKTVEGFPTRCGVYLMKSVSSNPIYIGKAKNLRSRVRSYFSNEKSLKNTFLLPRVRHIDYILTETEAEAYLLEAGLVKKHRPRYNVRLKDDKSYPYICCSMDETYPRFFLERRVKRKGAVYFGPYTDAGIARKMTQFLNEHFKVRDCSNFFMKGRTKPCLTYNVGYCTAPCVKKVSREKYLNQVKSAVAFLKGRDRVVLKSMERQMNRLSRAEQFESAGILRDRIKAIEFCRAKQVVVTKQKKDMDVMAFYGDERALLFQTLHIRAGAVTGHRSFYESDIKPRRDGGKKAVERSSLKGVKDPFFGAWGGASFIIQYYMDNLLPDLVLLADDFVDKDAFSVLERALCKIHDRPVCVRAPKGVNEKKLMNMALKNAQSRLKEQNEKKQSLLEGLQDIQKKFRLKNLPQRMECFDISHFQGEDQTAGQVVFEGGVPKTEDYRKYKIRTVMGVDDFLAMKEVLDRRFKRKEYPDPDLLIVDGGKGQLARAVQALREAGKAQVPVVAMAKARVKRDFSAKKVQASRERFFLPGRKNPVVFPSHSVALQILTHLRDEAHRFAVAYYRRLSHTTFFK